MFLAYGGDLELKSSDRLSFISFLEKIVKDYYNHCDYPDSADSYKYLLELQEEVMALKHSTSGTHSLFWQCSKKIAENISPDKLDQLPEEIREPIAAARLFSNNNRVTTPISVNETSVNEVKADACCIIQ